MRAVLTLPTPGREMSVQQLEDALAPTGWLLRESIAKEQWVHERIADLVARVSEADRPALHGADKFLIEPGHSAVGLVSLERREAVVIRLFQLDGQIEPMKAAVERVAAGLPDALVAIDPDGRRIQLEDRIIIRQDAKGMTVAEGRIVTPHVLNFSAYVRLERAREWRLVWVLGTTAVILVTLGLAAYVWGNLAVTWEQELKGYLERMATALLVAVITTFVNLLFEYREWHSVKTEVRWLFG